MCYARGCGLYLSYSYIVFVVSNATNISYGIPTVLLQECCVEEACCYGLPFAAARAWISEVSTPGSLDTGLVCNNPEVATQVFTLAPQDVVVALKTLLVLSRLAEVQACDRAVLFSRLVVDLRRNISRARQNCRFVDVNLPRALLWLSSAQRWLLNTFSRASAGSCELQVLIM